VAAARRLPGVAGVFPGAVIGGPAKRNSYSLGEVCYAVTLPGSWGWTMVDQMGKANSTALARSTQNAITVQLAKALRQHERPVIIRNKKLARPFDWLLWAQEFGIIPLRQVTVVPAKIASCGSRNHLMMILRFGAGASRDGRSSSLQPICRSARGG
jgi:hypothetical protein